MIIFFYIFIADMTAKLIILLIYLFICGFWCVMTYI